MVGIYVVVIIIEDFLVGIIDFDSVILFSFVGF